MIVHKHMKCYLKRSNYSYSLNSVLIYGLSTEEIEVGNDRDNIGYWIKHNIETTILSEQEAEEPLGITICGNGPDKPGQ